MSKKSVYLWSLVVLFLMWRIFGFAAALPRSESIWQTTGPVLEATTIDPDTVANEGIPVTGEERTGAGALFFSVLLGFIALFVILALLNIADKPIHPGTPDTS